MDQVVLAAQVREGKGKGAARRLRKNNQIPAIFYGPDTKPIMLAVDYQELKRIINQNTSENIIFDLQVKSDQGTETRKALLKDILIDPTKDIYLHADFYEISMDKKITVGVPIRLLNTPIGVTDGGILQHIRRELMVSCLPDKLIESLNIDVSGLDIGGSIHIKDIELPDGITSTEEGHLTVAVIAAPSVTPEEEVEEEVMEEIEGEEAETEVDSTEGQQTQEKTAGK
ncbi:MAG: 50S ribosomal protein L25 [Desulfobacteraceae bacterium]|nr:50S ribosomal protein L25 [Desulfobacteraceae bacterium]